MSPARPTSLTNAERQARIRQRKAHRLARLTEALERIRTITTAKEAREIAAEALADEDDGERRE